MIEEISTAIREGIEGAQVSVQLEGNRALITVVSEVFEPLSRVRKQQAVYACIEEFLRDGRLHAVTIRAITPAEAAGV